MIGALYHVHSLRFAIPAAVMLGVVPQYFFVWLTWRLVSFPFPHRVFQRGDELMYDFYQSLVCFFFETYSGAEVFLYGDPIPWDKQENVILLCNHQSSVDWVVSDLLAIRQGSLGRVRYILKSGLKYLPLYGFYFGQRSCIFVQRSGTQDQDHVGRKLEEMKALHIPMWLVIFPEGTRFNVENTAVVEKSQKFAAEHVLQLNKIISEHFAKDMGSRVHIRISSLQRALRLSNFQCWPFAASSDNKFKLAVWLVLGFPVLSHVLTPRTKATEVSFEKLYTGYLDAIYDLTIAYSIAHENPVPRKTAPSMPDFLSASGQQIHIYCRRHEPSDIPQDSEGRKDWIHRSFAEKDRILSKFYSEGGKMPGVPRKKRLSWLRTLPYFIFWMATLLPFLTTKWGRSAYWKMWLISGVGTVSYMTLLFKKG